MGNVKDFLTSLQSLSAEELTEVINLVSKKEEETYTENEIDEERWMINDYVAFLRDAETCMEVTSHYWAGENKTPSQGRIDEQVKFLAETILGDDEIDSSGCGGIEITRDTEYPEIFEIAYKKTTIVDREFLENLVGGAKTVSLKK